jgi:hypothetical protein
MPVCVLWRNPFIVCYLSQAPCFMNNFATSNSKVPNPKLASKPFPLLRFQNNLASVSLPMAAPLTCRVIKEVFFLHCCMKNCQRTCDIKGVVKPTGEGEVKPSDGWQHCSILRAPRKTFFELGVTFGFRGGSSFVLSERLNKCSLMRKKYLRILRKVGVAIGLWWVAISSQDGTFREAIWIFHQFLYFVNFIEKSMTCADQP